MVYRRCWRERAPPGPRAGQSPPLIRRRDHEDLLVGLARGPQAIQGDVMPDLPARPNLDQLRHQARDLLRAAHACDAAATKRIGAVSERLTLSAAQLVVARDYRFASRARPKAEADERTLD